MARIHALLMAQSDSMMNAAPDRLLIFDRDCGLCRAAIARMLHRGWLRAAEVEAFQELRDPLRSVVQAAGIQNAMVAVEPATGVTRAGLAGLLWIGSRRSRLARCLERGWLLSVLEIGYRLISYNRRFLSVPRTALRCACDPDDHLGYQGAFLLATVAWAILVTVAFGASVGKASGGTEQEGALWILAGAGGGWVLLCLASLGLGARRLRYLGHLGMTMALGVVPLLPAALLGLVFELGAAWVVSAGAAGALASFAWMAREQRRRLRFLELGRGWFLGWVASLCSSVAITALAAARSVAFG